MKNNKLQELYKANNKQLNYQSIASNLEGILTDEDVSIYPHYEKERLTYFLNKVNFENKKVLDIGGNMGFFTFEACNAGADHIDYYEGNVTRADFVKEGAHDAGVDEKISVFPCYYLFDQLEKKYDIAFLLNVVHHLGGDYGKSNDMDDAKTNMLASICQMAFVAKTMIFQMGFNWCGNVEHCLFEHGTKSEMEEFIQSGIKDYWDIDAIGVAVKVGNEIVYQDMNEFNNKRDDSLGEFLNRPIFIMHSKRFGLNI